MKQAALIIILFLLLSCTKNTTSVSTLSGIWVEQTLRLDTLDFELGDKFGTVNGNKTFFLNSSSSTNTNVYSYYFKLDTIRLSSVVSSFAFFGSYKFKMRTNNRFFDVERFYNRNSLPTTITFEKIK